MKKVKKMFILIVFTNLTILGNYLKAQEKSHFDTKWISSRPEVLTYKVNNEKWGEGMYQVSVFKTNDTIEVFTNIMLSNFIKMVWGKMTIEMIPLQSISKIIIDKQIIMDTKCNYQSNSLKITTQMKPYNKKMEDIISFEKQIIDFSQVAILLRTLYLEVGEQYSFNSLDPQKNKLHPFNVNVLSEENIQDIDCYKVEIDTFEGQAFYWIEKKSKFRVIRVEQPKDSQITELIF